MQKIKQDVTIVIEEFGAQAEVLIPAFELNDLRRERDEYLAQTVSDLYDRVVYMVRSNDLDKGEDPRIRLEVGLGEVRAASMGGTWGSNRREKQEQLKKTALVLFDQLLKIDEGANRPVGAKGEE